MYPENTIILIIKWGRGRTLPRKKSTTLTEAELRLMEVLWKRKESTVQDVLKDLPKGHTLAYTTVLTMLSILEKKGYLKHRKVSRAFAYYPVVKREEASQSAVKDVLKKFFNNSPELLVQSIFENEKIGSNELSHLMDMLEKDIG